MKERKSMTLEIRKVINRMYNDEGARVEDIAAKVGMHPTSIYLELRHGLTDEVNQKTGRFVYSIEKGVREAATARANRGRKTSENDGRANNGRRKTEASA